MIKLMTQHRFDEFVAEFDLPETASISFIKNSFAIVSTADDVKRIDELYRGYGYKTTMQLNKNADKHWNSSLIIDMGYPTCSGTFVREAKLTSEMLETV
jgi:hypothetical protein